jgi:hypothetical protein
VRIRKVLPFLVPFENNKMLPLNHTLYFTKIISN